MVSWYGCRPLDIQLPQNMLNAGPSKIVETFNTTLATILPAKITNILGFRLGTGEVDL